ncbi:hypothetical protein ACFX11_000729 [Malus domestica]
MAASIRRVGSSYSNSPGGGPSSLCHKATEPLSKLLSQQRRPKAHPGPSCANNPLGPGRNLSSADSMRSKRHTTPTRPTYGSSHFRNPTHSCGPLGDPDRFNCPDFKFMDR